MKINTAGNKDKLQTPIGDLVLTSVTAPGRPNYDEDGFEYCAGVIISDSQKAEYLKQFQEYAASKGVTGKLAHTPIKEVTDKETGEVLYTFLKAHTKTTWPDGRPNTVKVKNTKNQVINLVDGVGKGSRGAFIGVLAITGKKNKGVSCFLSSLLLTKYVPYSDDEDFEVGEVDEGSVVVIDGDDQFEASTTE